MRKNYRRFSKKLCVVFSLALCHKSLGISPSFTPPLLPPPSSLPLLTPPPISCNNPKDQEPPPDITTGKKGHVYLGKLHEHPLDPKVETSPPE
ncbi:hypothetical protein NQZ68_024538 [Dissostichus eleginoides]|nr:hypothetical protein NQZ68_024538 [Dissostichus eleginoides]